MFGFILPNMTFLTIILILLSLFLILLILLQRSSGGMGSAMGGGAADQVFGGGSAAVLTKWTVWGILLFFVISFILYLVSQSGTAIPETTPSPPGIKSDPNTPVQTDGNVTPASPQLNIPPAGPPPPSTIPENNGSLAPKPDLNTTKPGTPDGSENKGDK